MRKSKIDYIEIKDSTTQSELMQSISTELMMNVECGMLNE
jgi:hypothetical protein